MSPADRLTLSAFEARCRDAGIPFSRSTFYRRYRGDAAWLEQLDAQDTPLGITFDTGAALDWILRQIHEGTSRQAPRLGVRTARANRLFRPCLSCSELMHVRARACRACGAPH
jgi:hypothetical protein